ncbi:MAG TPA: GNAT family N-acetyltransferase [Fibrobacteria bacterium]|nr:GNAT family N-acetyltransferase [Fibrobacteria bacterium]
MSQGVHGAGIRVSRADLENPDHQAAILALVDMYARDPVGGGKPLPDAVRAALIPGLKAHPTTVVFLAHVAAQAARAPQAVGVAVCFRGVSTFAARPLLNIHDLAVRPEFRGRGVGRSLLEAAERYAAGEGCCKLTLEVLARNAPARKLYHAFGFQGAGFFEGEGGGEGGGNCLFYVKPL